MELKIKLRLIVFLNIVNLGKFTQIHHYIFKDLCLHIEENKMNECIYKLLIFYVFYNKMW